MNNFKNKVVVVTGGATGIGFSFAKQFGREGAKVVIASRRIKRVNEAVKKLQALGIEATGTVCDVAILSDVEALADFAWGEFGQVDVIVNNAGVGPKLKSVIDMSREDIMRILDVNLLGAWNGVSVFGKRMIEQATPCAIYNVGSENSLFNVGPMLSGYIVSKHALHAMTVSLREEVPDFVEVGLICPGIVNSEIGGGITFGMDTDKFTGIAMSQIKEGKFYIVSHAYGMVRINERQTEIKEAYETYAPRYEGDIEFDVRTIYGQTATIR